MLWTGNTSPRSLFCSMSNANKSSLSRKNTPHIEAKVYRMKKELVSNFCFVKISFNKFFSSPLPGKFAQCVGSSSEWKHCWLKIWWNSWKSFQFSCLIIMPPPCNPNFNTVVHFHGSSGGFWNEREAWLGTQSMIRKGKGLKRFKGWLRLKGLLEVRVWTTLEIRSFLIAEILVEGWLLLGEPQGQILKECEILQKLPGKLKCPRLVFTSSNSFFHSTLSLCPLFLPVNPPSTHQPSTFPHEKPPKSQFPNSSVWSQNRSTKKSLQLKTPKLSLASSPFQNFSNHKRFSHSTIIQIFPPKSSFSTLSTYKTSTPTFHPLPKRDNLPKTINHRGNLNIFYAIHCEFGGNKKQENFISSVVQCQKAILMI
jgi:hypothetical protein